MKTIKIMMLLSASVLVFTSGCEKQQMLFNGLDLTGWQPFVPDKNVALNKVWFVKDNAIHCTGNPAGYIRTTEDYSNYKLHLEWRWTDTPGNSGVLLHMSEPDVVWPKSIEAQLLTGNAGDFHVIGGTDFKEHKGLQGSRTPKMKDSNEKPAGQWNEYDIICVGDTIELYVNKMLQNKATETTVTQGKICLQSEGAPIEFRNIYIIPLD